MRVRLPASGWTPRDYQRPLWDKLKGGAKRVIAIWHRRAGKDEVALHHTACSIFERPGNYWHMLPEATQARKAIWESINPHSGKRRIDEAFPVELRETTRENEMLIRFRAAEGRAGATWQVVGSDNYQSLIGSPPLGIVFSEWARADPAAWAYLRPILVENDGWAMFITTPFGRNHAATMFEAYADDPTWFVERLRADETGAIPADRLETERQEYIRDYGPTIGAKLFEQEYFCSFDAPIVGAYYADLMTAAERDKRICHLPFDPTARVETWWDLGYSDATSIWFVQRIGHALHVIDYYEGSGVGLEHYAKVMTEKANAGGWTYSAHVWPHDGGHGSVDTGETRDRIAARLGFKPIVLPRGDIDDGIQAVRSILPRCWFDKAKCERGIEALRQYRADYDEKLRALKRAPRHDWSSHAADAFRAGAKYVPPAASGRVWEKREISPRIAIA